MPETQAVIAGSVVAPAGVEITNGEVHFILSASDTEDDTVIAPVVTVAVLDGENLPDGTTLWVNAEGQAATRYRVVVRWRAEGARPGDISSAHVGDIQLSGAGPFDLAAELRRGVTLAPAETFWMTITQDDYNTMLTARDETNAAAASAALSAGSAAADRVQTGLDREATGADRAAVQELIDVVGSGLTTWVVYAGETDISVTLSAAPEVIVSETAETVVMEFV